MANRYALPILVLAAAALLAVLFYFYKPAAAKYNWNDSWDRKAYSDANREPYGSTIFFRLLEHYFPGHSVHKLSKDPATELPSGQSGAASYVFIGGGLFLDSLDTDKLLNFVGEGNTALIISKSIPFDLMSYIYYDECDEDGWDDYQVEEDSAMQFSFADTALNGAAGKGYAINYSRQNKVTVYHWNYIEDRHFCDSLPQRPLGYMNDSLINFAWFPYGKGQFLLQTTPVAFSNYNLLRPGGRQYTEKVLSFLPAGDIYWDNASRVPEIISRKRNRTAANIPEEHPLSYLLQQPALAWAWYLLFGLAALFLLFRAKRQQRIIPVLPKNENSSYEFISTIANLHFRQKDYRNMSIQIMRLFLAQLRDRYGIVAPLQPDNLPRIDNAIVDRLERISEVPGAQIWSIFTLYNNCIRYEPNEDMLIDLHQAIESFERSAK